MDQEAHVASSSVEIVDEHVARAHAGSRPSLTIGKLHVGSGSKDWNQVRIELEGLIRLRGNSVTVEHQDSFDRRYNTSSHLAVTDVGFHSAHDEQFRAFGLGRRCKNLLYCRCFDTVARLSACVMHDRTAA